MTFSTGDTCPPASRTCYDSSDKHTLKIQHLSYQLIFFRKVKCLVRKMSPPRKRGRNKKTHFLETNREKRSKMFPMEKLVFQRDHKSCGKQNCFIVLRVDLQIRALGFHDMMSV